MPNCDKKFGGCGTGWSLKIEELDAPKEFDESLPPEERIPIKIHPTPCKCGNQKPRVGKDDHKKARALVGAPQDWPVKDNPGGDIAANLESLAFWLVTNEADKAKPLVQGLRDAKTDPILLIKAFLDHGGQLVNDEKAVKPDEVVSEKEPVVLEMKDSS